VENRHGLIVEATVTPAAGRAECEAALSLLHRQRVGVQPDVSHRVRPDMSFVCTG